MRKTLSVLSLVSLVSLGWSCAGSSTSLEPGQSQYSAVSGMFSAVEPASYESVVRATMQAMEKLRLNPLERDRDGFRTAIVGESVFGNLSQSHEVRVWISRLTSSTTQIDIRVLGRRDEGRIRTIHEEIRSQLKKPGGAG